MENVHVRYGFGPKAQAELAFAIDLAIRLSRRLFVWTGSDRDARALLERIDPHAAGRENAHVRDRVRLDVSRREAGLALSFGDGDPYESVRDRAAIIIGARDARKRPSAMAIAAMGETSLMARGGGEICLPFANGESALHAASIAVPLAAKLGLPLFLYHTTWRDERVPGGLPAEMHMTKDACDIRKEIEASADRAGVKHRAVIETATAIAEGTVRSALNAHCALIVLARGRHVGRGSYVDQVLERSVIPVLVAGRSRA